MGIESIHKVYVTGNRGLDMNEEVLYQETRFLFLVIKFSEPRLLNLN